MSHSFSDWISFCALFISLFTFLYNFHTSKSNIKIIVDEYNLFPNIDDDEKYNLAIKCSLENHSKYPIRVTKAEFNGNNCFPQKISLSGYGYQKLGQSIIFENCSFSFPIKLDTYESCNGNFLFESDKPIELKHFNLLKIYTTRGVHYFFIRGPRNKKSKK